MDPNIGRIPTEPTQPPRAVPPAKRGRREGRAFDEELSEGADRPPPAHADDADDAHPEDDLPVAPPADGDVGGTLDVTA